MHRVADGDIVEVRARQRYKSRPRRLSSDNANVDLLAFSGFPQGRNKAQSDIVTDDFDGLKAAAKRHKWKLSRSKRAFLVRGTDEVGVAVPPLAKVAGAKINVIAVEVVAAGEGRFGMLLWVEARNYNRAAKLLEAL